jgi:hypothetical protein
MAGPISVSKTFPSVQSTSAQNILNKLKTKIYRYKEDIKVGAVILQHTEGKDEGN